MHSKPLLALAGLCLTSVSFAQTATVTTIEDIVDFGGAMTVADLPGPDGLVSFREAVFVANNTPGPQTIAFAIPQSGWGPSNQFAELKLELGVFYVTDDGTTIDFSTQTAFTGNTNPNGREVGIFGLQANGWGSPAIGIDASNCVVRGLGQVSLRKPAVWIGGGTGNRVVGCVTSMVQLDPQPFTTRFNVIGGTDPLDGNILQSVEVLCSAHDNVVIGNRIGSVRVEGAEGCAIQYAERNRIGGPTPAERNVIAGAGHYTSEGFPTGYNIKVEWARDTLIEGNYIGVTANGMQRFPQVAPTGIHILEALDTTVRDNLIAGMRVAGSNHHAGSIYGRAIWITAINRSHSGVIVEGNKIGTDVTGTQEILTLNGIQVDLGSWIRSVDGVRIGGRGPGQGNTIAFTRRTGIAVVSNGVQAEITGNSIHDNGRLGIDLSAVLQGADGVTPNDLGDGDSGGNSLQNFPVLVASRTSGTAVGIRGVLNSQPLREYRIEFFSNTNCDPTGHGECERFLGARRVTTDAAGNAVFREILRKDVLPGTWITATATDLVTKETSECAACVRTRSGVVAVDIEPQ